MPHYEYLFTAGSVQITTMPISERCYKINVNITGSGHSTLIYVICTQNIYFFLLAPYPPCLGFIVLTVVRLISGAQVKNKGGA